MGNTFSEWPSLLKERNGAQIPLNANGTAYTLSIGPQIGPRFDQLPKNADYRKYILEVNGKKKLETPKAGSLQVIKELPTWGALAEEILHPHRDSRSPPSPPSAISRARIL